MHRLIPFILLFAAACAPRPDTAARPDTAPRTIEKSPPQVDVTVLEEVVPPPLDARTAVRNFAAVVADVEPVAEAICTRAATQSNCDFRIVVDDRPGQPPNAFQTLDLNGQPIIGFTIPLIAEARNRDEVAFILAHEAAHHIEGHIARGQRNAQLGAELAQTIAGAVGTDALQEAAQIGAVIGARTFSREFELEADALGTVIALEAGYDPIVGARFFTRIPDPGNQFLGTHPANADRVATVERIVAQMTRVR